MQRHKTLGRTSNSSKGGTYRRTASDSATTSPSRIFGKPCAHAGSPQTSAGSAAARSDLRGMLPTAARTDARWLAASDVTPPQQHKHPIDLRATRGLCSVLSRYTVRLQPFGAGTWE